MKSIGVESYGGTDQLVYRDVEKPEPGFTELPAR
jgi:hypothetical protein